MKFVKNNVYTAVNADKLKKGDKVVVADTIMDLRDFIEGMNEEVWYTELKKVLPGNCAKRFSIEKNLRYALAYLIERAGEKPKEKPQPKYRPFKNIK